MSTPLLLGSADHVSTHVRSEQFARRPINDSEPAPSKTRDTMRVAAPDVILWNARRVTASGPHGRTHGRRHGPPSASTIWCQPRGRIASPSRQLARHCVLARLVKSECLTLGKINGQRIDGDKLENFAVHLSSRRLVQSVVCQCVRSFELLCRLISWTGHGSCERRHPVHSENAWSRLLDALCRSPPDARRFRCFSRTGSLRSEAQYPRRTSRTRRFPARSRCTSMSRTPASAPPRAVVTQSPTKA